jgi:hypothetical protein
MSDQPVASYMSYLLNNPWPECYCLGAKQLFTVCLLKIRRMRIEVPIAVTVIWDEIRCSLVEVTDVSEESSACNLRVNE